ETSPVISINTPMHYHPNKVGRLLPGINFRLLNVEGLEKGGQLLIKAPNVMLGYISIDQPEKIIPHQDGWYDTGDIVEIDEEGFLTILGRVKRFAKIAGEMVSLTAVEQVLSTLWPTDHHAVIARPDKQKGEQLIL